MRRAPWLLLGVATLAWASAHPAGMELPAAEGMVPLGAAGDVVALDAGGQVLASSGGEWVKLPDLGAWLAVRPVAAVSRLVVDRRTPFLPVRKAVEAMVESGRRLLQFAGGEAEGLEILQDINTEPAAASKPGASSLGASFDHVLTIHLRADGVWVGRTVGMGVDLPGNGLTSTALDTLGSLLDLDRQLHPAGRLAVINTDDDVPFGQAFSAIGAVQTRGLDQVLLAGGPPGAHLPGGDDLAAEAAGPGDRTGVPTPPPGPAARPKKVGVLPSGRFIIDGTRVVDATQELRFWEDCAGERCTVMLEQPPGKLTVLGTRAANAGDPTRRWIFGHEVHAAPGLAGTGPEVALNGKLSAFPQLGVVTPDPASAQQEGVIMLGALSKEVIDAAIKQQAMPLVRDCYVDLLDRSPDATGKLTVWFVIDADGKVARAELTTAETGDAPFQQCLIDAMMSVAFPAPRGRGIVIVTYPFVFSPE
ncbi:MAG: AgmX/PglI C-terminal domain-containing protein [Deltaproteobacteria bacterium]|nr:AgmX/PglI C-terminal domain-containing protein [Deltaproteobacteria bacterium]